MADTTQKIAISDMDGTLLFEENGKRVFREQDLEAIRRFQKSGNLMVLNSGRTVNWLTLPLEGYIEWDYLIASTGAILVSRDEVIASHPLDKIQIARLLEHMESHGNVMFQTRDYVYALNPSAMYGVPMVSIQGLEDVQEDIYGVSVHFETEDEASAYVTWFQQQQIHSIACYQNRNDIDMVAAGCSKGTGIRELSDYLHIPMDQCYAIGDSYNDIEMLKSVKHAYTFYDAPEEVKQHTEKQVSSVAEMIQEIE